MEEGTPPRLLLEGRPGIGESTLARRLLALLQQAGVPVAGFTTAELRTGGRREGFAGRGRLRSAGISPMSTCLARHGSAGTAWT